MQEVQNMSRPRTYKKHMKHATDLFWLPRDSRDSGVHWTFDESYSVTKHEAFTGESSDDYMHSREDRTFPVPTFTSESTSETENTGSGGEQERSAYRRIFLEFPDGFWSDMYASESHAPSINPVSTW
jgi:hypothetical protein